MIADLEVLDLPMELPGYLLLLREGGAQQTLHLARRRQLRVQSACTGHAQHNTVYAKPILLYVVASNNAIPSRIRCTSRS